MNDDRCTWNVSSRNFEIDTLQTGRDIGVGVTARGRTHRSNFKDSCSQYRKVRLVLPCIANSNVVVFSMNMWTLGR